MWLISLALCCWYQYLLTYYLKFHSQSPPTKKNVQVVFEWELGDFLHSQSPTADHLRNMWLVDASTPPKINMESENDGLEDDFPLPGVYSQVPC